MVFDPDQSNELIVFDSDDESTSPDSPQNILKGWLYNYSTLIV